MENFFFLVPDEWLWPPLCIARELENTTQMKWKKKKAQGIWNKSWREGAHTAEGSEGCLHRIQSGWYKEFRRSRCTHIWVEKNDSQIALLQARWHFTFMAGNIAIFKLLKFIIIRIIRAYLICGSGFTKTQVVCSVSLLMMEWIWSNLMDTMKLKKSQIISLARMSEFS